MAEQSFTSSVEKALKRGQLSPAERAAAKRLAQLTPRERAIQATLNLKRAAGAAKNVGAAAEVVAPAAEGLAGTVGRTSLGKAFVPLAVAEQAFQLGKILVSDGTETANDYADLSKGNAISRTITGGLRGIPTIVGSGQALADIAGTSLRTRKSEEAVAEKMKAPKMRGLVDDAKERQSVYMSLPKEEQDKIDSMSGKDAKQYLMDKQNAGAPEPKSAPAPATTSTPKSSESYFSKPEGKPTEIDRALIEGVGKRIVEMEGDNIPKAIPVAEPVKVDSERALALFQNTHGIPFDPKSSMDKDKMAAIQSLMAQKGSEKLTPNQFSLQIYRQSK